MLPLCNEDILREGFCVGVHYASVDRGYRIRLCKAIIEVMRQHKVQQLWEFPDPTGPRLILCPPQFRNAYVEIAKQNLSAALETEVAYRKFIYAGQPVSFGAQGRILIKQAFRGHLKVKATDDVVLFGTGGWYELWPEKDWTDRDSGHGT